MYIMFPIAWMYYFGTNLDERFAVPDFWPKPEQTYKIPYEKHDIQSELERLKQRRLERRAKRIADLATEGSGDLDAPDAAAQRAIPREELEKKPGGGWLNWAQGPKGH